MTDGRGADVAICANPVAATHAQAVELVRKRGTVVLFGGLPKADPTTALDANRIHYGEIRVVGSFSYHPSFHSLALDAIARGTIHSDQVITHTFPLDEVERAFRGRGERRRAQGDGDDGSIQGERIVIGLHEELRAREAEGRPVRVGLIGAGQMGTDVVATTRMMAGLQVVVTADIDIARAVDAYRIAQVDAEVIVAANGWPRRTQPSWPASASPSATSGS